MGASRGLGRAGRRAGPGALVGVLVGVGLMMAAPSSVAIGHELRVPVLMYHRITKAPPDAGLPELWVAPRRFRAQLDALRDRGWRTITAEELGAALMEGRTVGRKRFVITIDDGARDGYTNGAPILEDLGMRATFCVVPGRSWKPWQLSFRHMRRLRGAGHEIANHSLHHADLPSLSRTRLRREVVGASRLIRERVGHAPRSFCYPFGRNDRRVRRVVKAADHVLAFTTVYGARESTRSPMRSPRIRINGSDRPAEVVAKLRPYARGGTG